MKKDYQGKITYRLSTFINRKSFKFQIQKFQKLISLHRWKKIDPQNFGNELNFENLQKNFSLVGLDKVILGLDCVSFIRFLYNFKNQYEKIKIKKFIKKDLEENLNQLSIIMLTQLQLIFQEKR